MPEHWLFRMSEIYKKRAVQYDKMVPNSKEQERNEERWENRKRNGNQSAFAVRIAARAAALVKCVMAVMPVREKCFMRPKGRPVRFTIV